MLGHMTGAAVYELVPMGQEPYLTSTVGAEVGWRLGLTVQTRLPEMPAGEEL